MSSDTYFIYVVLDLNQTREQQDARRWGHDRLDAQYWEQDRDERDRRR